MLISELAQLTGVSIHALRHYERAGLLKPRRLPNGYRDYPRSARREVVFIAMSRALGFGLPRIAENLRAWRAGRIDRKSTRLNSSHLVISYAVFCLKKKITNLSACSN